MDMNCTDVVVAGDGSSRVSIILLPASTMPATEAVVAGIGDPSQRLDPASTMPATDAVVAGIGDPGQRLGRTRARPATAIRPRSQPSRHELGFAGRNPTFDYSSRLSAARDRRTVLAR